MSEATPKDTELENAAQEGAGPLPGQAKVEGGSGGGEAPPADHADVLAALGDGHARQLLDREREADVVQDGRGVVQAVGVGEAVVPRPLLAQLLEAAVEVADLDLDVDDGLAVEAEVELDGAVRRRVRRPHLDLHHVACGTLRARHHAAPLRCGYQGWVMGSRSGTSGWRLSTG